MGATELWEYQDAESLYRAAASMVRTLALFRAGKRGRALLALSGDCPARVYSLLAGEQYQAAIPWELADLVWTSAVFGDSGQDGLAMARDTLLSKVPVSPERVRGIDVSIQPEQAAASYAERLRKELGDPMREVELDVAVLAMREDGLLAESAVARGEEWMHHGLLHGGGQAVGRKVEQGTGQERTLAVAAMPPAVLNRSFALMLLAVGEKAGAGIKSVLPPRKGKGRNTWLNPRNRFVVFVDYAARAAMT